MPNFKYQKKRSITNLNRNAAKSAEKSALKTAIKEVLVEVEAKDKEKAVAAYNTANSLLDKAVTSHLKHKNYTARQKARLAKAVNSL